MSRRSLLILLFLSLALNLFIVGAGVGAYLLGGHLPGRGRLPTGGGPPMFAAAQALPSQEADAYRDTLSIEANAVRPTMRKARLLRHDAWLKLGADPLDSAAIVADLDRARSLQAQAQSEMDHKIVDFAAHLPAVDRAKFGEALSQPPPRDATRRAQRPTYPPARAPLA